VTDRFRLRRAHESDAEFARLTHHAAYRDVVERQFGAWDEVQQDGFFFAQWDPAATEVILDDGHPSGYCCVERRGDDIHLRELVVHPDRQGRGIGTWLVEELQREAAEVSIPVRLGTFHKNRALQLYRRLGFTEINATDTHVLMEWVPR